MASFTGNISEWEWTRGNSTDTYSLEYDALSRIVDSRLFRNGNPVDALSESGISYDSNGNILSLTRTGEDGSAVNDLTYHYDGNRLTSLSDGVLQSQNYTYDADGNMTFDGRTGMSLTWNDLGLVKKVSLNDTDLVNYSYLADGTKVSALDNEGNGLLYLGSLIYKKTGDSIELESAGFAGGRFVARETEDDGKAMVPMIHVTDHLGSVRAVVDGVSGEVVETNDYYPFGGRWNTTAGLTDQTNRFRYNSKEEQSSLYPASFRNAVSYIDYGARQYDPILGRWFAQDPLSEKYYGISPYAFCANNSIVFVDYNGKDWVKNMETGQYEWNDDINSESEIPEGYIYVGATTFDVLNHLNINTKYPTQYSSIFLFTGEQEKGNVIIMTYKTFLAHLTASAIVSYNTSDISPNNSLGLTFEGVKFTATLVQSSSNDFNPYVGNISAVLNLNYGNDVFSTIMVKSTEPIIKETGTNVISGSVIIPASIFASHLAFGKASIHAGATNASRISTNRKISWGIEKWPMFRPVK